MSDPTKPSSYKPAYPKHQHIQQTLTQMIVLGTLDDIRQAIRNGASVNAALGKEDKDGGQSPLHVAIAFHRNDAVYLLLDLGARVNATDNLGYTPLHLAVENGETELVKVLLAPGADTSLRDKEHHMTPLEWAHRLSSEGRDRLEIAQLLTKLDSGKSKHETNSDRFSNHGSRTPPLNQGGVETEQPLPATPLIKHANWIAPLAAFILTITTMGSVNGKIGLGGLLGSLALAGVATLISQAVTNTGLFSMASPIGGLCSTQSCANEQRRGANCDPAAPEFQDALNQFKSGYVPQLALSSGENSRPNTPMKKGNSRVGKAM